MKVEARNTERIKGLHPLVAIRAHAMIDLCRIVGIQVLVTNGYRTNDDQDNLYTWGRTQYGSIITYARGGLSYHNYGLAFDVVSLDKQNKPQWDDTLEVWATMGRIGQSVGLRWGGTWKKSDLSHFELLTEMTPLNFKNMLGARTEDMARVWDWITLHA